MAAVCNKKTHTKKNTKQVMLEYQNVIFLPFVLCTLLGMLMSLPCPT